VPSNYVNYNVFRGGKCGTSVVEHEKMKWQLYEMDR
jgi:hypothetical protein